MIDISHAQTRRLIRTALDLALPQAQWNALQAHVENCAECRAYWDRQEGVERQLQRMTNASWHAASPATGWKALSAQVIAQRKARDIGLRKLRNGLLVCVAVVLLIGGYINRAWLGLSQGQVPVTAAQPAAPTPTLTPTPAGPPFQGVIAFDAPAIDPAKNAPAGAKDIYLLASGPGGTDLTDLTDHASHNTDPAWSADGQWIAFISDRVSNGKPGGANDIFMMTVAGTRLTRLTHSGDMAWKGPLSWSTDRRWIAAEGTPVAAGPAENSLYILPVDGSGPPRLLSAGGSHPKFSPTQPWLAFVAPGDVGLELYVYDYQSGTEFSITGTGSWPVASLRDGSLYIGEGDSPATAYDWLDDGRTLSYVSQRTQNSAGAVAPTLDIRQAIDLPLDFSNVSFVLARRSNPLSLHLVWQASLTSRVQYITWSDSGDMLYVPQSSAGACGQTLQAWQDPQRDAPPLKVPPLCLLGQVQSTNWMVANGPGGAQNWLVVAGQAGAGDPPGLFALHIPPQDQSGRAVSVQRLANLPKGAGVLQVRPEVK